MPYEGEFAHHRSLRRLVTSERVNELLSRCERPVHDPSVYPAPVTDFPRRAWDPKLVIAVDGSHYEEPVVKGYPGAEVSYISIATVLLDVERLRQLEALRPANPLEFNELEKVRPMDFVLPGRNVKITGMADDVTSFRRELFEIMDAFRADDEAETLLETYEKLLAHKPSDAGQRCPAGDACDGDRTFTARGGRWSCACGKAETLYSTDALRIHHVLLDQSRQDMFAEVMQVLEHLWLVAMIRWLERKRWLGLLRRLAFVMDGPLAIFGHPAWLSKAMGDELRRINQEARRVNEEDLLVFGIEKSGQFFDHLQMIDLHENGTPGRLSCGSLFLLDDTYIKRNIIFSRSPKPYGADTYYGRKFLYKTRTGALIVGVTPFLHNGDDDLTRAAPAQHPRLGDALDLLDNLVSARYPNAVIPLVAAHAEAAIPVRVGKMVLAQLAQDLIQKGAASS